MSDTITGWAIDFVRAFHERPRLYRILFRIAVGRYAFNEFLGMVTAEDLTLPYSDYELEEMGYHKQHDKFVWRWVFSNNYEDLDFPFPDPTPPEKHKGVPNGKTP